VLSSYFLFYCRIHSFTTPTLPGVFAAIPSVHNEHKKGEGYKGNQKRRPRDEWVINENTHETLISTEEAEQILSQLENSHIGKKISDAKTGASATC